LRIAPRMRAVLKMRAACSCATLVLSPRIWGWGGRVRACGLHTVCEAMRRIRRTPSSLILVRALRAHGLPLECQLVMKGYAL